jgi:hypothetical protein
MSATTGSPPLARLTQLHAAYLAAFGDASHPLVTLMRAALASGSESIGAAVLEHVEADRAKTHEALALAAVARSLDANQRPPTLWLAADVQAVRPAEMQTLDNALRADGAVRVPHRFMREADTAIDGAPLAARILFPASSAGTGHVEAAGRVLRDVWRNWVVPASDARAALLRAALEKKG